MQKTDTPRPNYGGLPKGRSGNKNIRALIQRFRPGIDAFARDYPFLGGFILEVFNDRGHNFKMGYETADALISLLRITGAASVLSSPEAIDGNPEVFWTLLDEAKHQDSERMMKGVLCLYHAFYWKHYLGERFESHPKSPAPFIHHLGFQELVLKEYITSADLFFIGYSKNCNRRPIVIHYRNNDLRDMVVEAFINWPNKSDLASSSLKLLHEAEGWFEEKARNVHSFEDLREDVLSTGVEHILRTEPGPWRILRMQFLFWIFSYQIRTHPQHRFFEGSHIWSPGIVINKVIPVHIAKGFHFAVYGQTDEVKQDRGILLIVKDGDLLSSSGRKEQIYQIDLSKVTVPLYWRILGNYAVHHSETRASAAKGFFLWIMEKKEKEKTPYDRITSDDLYQYRVHVSHLVSNGTARNKYINDAKKVLRWAEDHGYITTDYNAYEHFVYFDYHYTPQPSPVSLDDIRRALDAADRLTETFDERFALMRIIIRILLTCELRVGSLCRMRIDDLIVRPDGSMVYVNRIKKHGAAKHDIILSKGTADLIREALEITAPVRKECPAGMLDGVVFIYRNPSCAPLPYGGYTTTRVSNDLKSISKEAGLKERLSSGRLRDTYMTAVERYARQNGLTDLQQMVLTKHAAKFSTRSYTRLNLSDMLTRCDNITLGTI